MYDFHTHTFLSDGVLSPIELIRRALVQGYKAMAVTDHVGLGNVEYVVRDRGIGRAMSYTAMTMAAVGGYYDIVQLLLEHGADPGMKNYIGRKQSQVDCLTHVNQLLSLDGDDRLMEDRRVAITRVVEVLEKWLNKPTGSCSKRKRIE